MSEDTKVETQSNNTKLEPILYENSVFHTLILKPSQIIRNLCWVVLWAVEIENLDDVTSPKASEDSVALEENHSLKVPNIEIIYLAKTLFSQCRIPQEFNDDAA